MKFLLSLTILFTFSSSFAGDYQAQGCGLGSTLWRDGTSLTHQVLGVSTNTTSGQTFAMTSGTSNCELEGAEGFSQVKFIEANMLALSNDIAMGKGQYLTSLMDMYNCRGNQAYQTLKSNYGKIFNDNSSAGTINTKIKNILISNKACI